MKKLITLIMTVFMVAGLQIAVSQEAQNRTKIYTPEANAKEDLNNAIKKAKAEGKHVLVQIGGNWCSWCLQFHAFINDDAEIKKFIADHYVFTLLNYSTENKNKELMVKYHNPGRMGYPVFLILDGKGQMIHTQDSGLLEEGRGYSKAKVKTFLTNWTPTALDTNDIK